MCVAMGMGAESGRTLDTTAFIVPGEHVTEAAVREGQPRNAEALLGHKNGDSLPTTR